MEVGKLGEAIPERRPGSGRGAALSFPNKELDVRTVGGRLKTTAGARLRAPSKQTDPVYRTSAHRRWAEAVVQHAGGRCEGCGVPGKTLYADHIVELKDGGNPTDPLNGQALCGSCRGKKTAGSRANRHKGGGSALSPT